MSDPFYRSSEWRWLRQETLMRDPFCRTPGCNRLSTHADHIVARKAGGPDTLSNLRGLCTSCHNRRSARGNAEPRLVGCDAAGLPLDPLHPWNVASTPKNLSELSDRGPARGRARSKFQDR